MRKLIPATLALLVAATGSGAGTFPGKVTYHIFIYGEYAGKCATTITEKGNVLILESDSKVALDAFEQTLSSRTEVDRKSFEPISFTYQGTKMKIPISGSLSVKGGSIQGELVEDGNPFPSKKRVDEFLVLFQNYVVDHQIVLLNAVGSSTEPYKRFEIFFPSDFASTSCIGILESEVELPTSPKPSVCRKYRIESQGSPPFFGFYDPKRRVPVYMDFPATNTEIFLASAYGESPGTKYTRPDSDSP